MSTFRAVAVTDTSEDESETESDPQPLSPHPSTPLQSPVFVFPEPRAITNQDLPNVAIQTDELPLVGEGTSDYYSQSHPRQCTEEKREEGCTNLEPPATTDTTNTTPENCEVGWGKSLHVYHQPRTRLHVTTTLHYATATQQPLQLLNSSTLGFEEAPPPTLSNPIRPFKALSEQDAKIDPAVQAEPEPVEWENTTAEVRRDHLKGATPNANDHTAHDGGAGRPIDVKQHVVKELLSDGSNNNLEVSNHKGPSSRYDPTLLFDHLPQNDYQYNTAPFGPDPGGGVPYDNGTFKSFYDFEMARYSTGSMTITEPIEQ